MTDNNLHPVTTSYPKPNDWIETTLGLIPNNWEIVPAEKFCIKVADGTHDSPKKSEKGKLLITSKNIKDGKLDTSSAYLIALKDFDEVNKRSKVDKWDVLLSMIGTVGEVCLISNEPDFAIKNVGLFKCGNESNAKWLYYFLRCTIGQNHLLSRLNGTTQKYITLGELRNFPIIVPINPDEQKAIVAVLSAFDDKIELLREENKTLEEIGKTIFNEWFGKYSVDDELPEGWRIGKLGEICEINTGKRPNKVSDIKTTTLNIPLVGASKIMGYVEEYLFEDDTLVIGRVGTHGIIQRFNEKIFPSDNTLVIKSFNFEYTYQILNNIDYEKINRGAVQPLITRTDLLNYPINIPPEDMLQIFKEKTNPIYKKINGNNLEIQFLSATRDNILPKLMSGELRVSNIEEYYEKNY